MTTAERNLYQSLRLKVLNSSTTLQELERIATNKSLDVKIRAFVAKSYRCPAHLFEKLASDHPHIRAAVASNTYCPQHVLFNLSKDPDPKVRRNIVRNESTPVSTLMQMALEEKDELILSELARDHNERLPPLVFDVLYKRDSHQINWILCIKKRLPATIANFLADDSDVGVRRRTLIYQMKKLSSETFARLAKDPDPAIQRIIKRSKP
jgi:hypothetical protein